MTLTLTPMLLAGSNRRKAYRLRTQYLRRFFIYVETRILCGKGIKCETVQNFVENIHNWVENVKKEIPVIEMV